MSLAPGARLGPYEILSALGARGMGEVYRARDARLGRDVAIKVLPADVTTDAERLRRFEQEARAVASLNHPNILAVYDIGHAGSSTGSGQAAPYIVSELLDGETLRARLAAGPLTARTAVEYSVHIARGLAAAHEKNLVHRDLKPDNVFITADDRVKILDFGLAKLASPADAGPDDTERGPSLTRLQTKPPLTAAGLVLGTVGYMAPEQVRGLPTDQRADIFALGAVLYEMLSGRRAFNGDTAADVMTAILKEEPPELPTDVRQIAPALARIVDRCLAKNPNARFKSADDLAFALEGLSSSSSSGALAAVDTASPSRSKRSLSAVAFVGLGALLTAAVLIPLLRQRDRVDDKPVVRLQLTLPDDVTPVRGQPPAVSPDGTRIAMVAVDQTSGKRLIYLRPLNSLSAQTVRGTDRAIYPFWSADGGRMGFFADGRLKTVDLGTGTVQDVCAVPNPGAPGIWVDDTIVFARTAGPLDRVSASGGTAVPSTAFDAGKENGQSVAGFLADRRRFIFGTNAFGLSTLRIGSTDGSLVQPIAAAGSRGLLHVPWLNTAGAVLGHLLFIRESALLAIAINGTSAQTTGEPQPLAQSVSPLSSGAALSFSVQDTVLAYVSSANSASRLVWVNRQGQTLGPAGALSGFLRDVRISPDGSLVTVSRFNDADRVYDLMLLDVRRMTTSQLTYGTSAFQTSWLHDGSEIFFTNVTAKGSMLVRMVPQEGASQVPVVPPGNAVIVGPDISPDGRSLAYLRVRVDGNGDLYLHSLEKPGEERPLLATPAYENSPRFSPVGTWIAYQSNETGSPEIFVRSFPAGGEKQQVSRGGAYRPVWRRDGKELFYLSPDGDLMAVAIMLTPSLVVGPPEKLFRTPIDPGGAITYFQFDVHPDNQRFIMTVPVTDAPQPVNVILNWQSLLKK
jgi:serine/threonine protein kinase/Tol biopolymer transport system component